MRVYNQSKHPIDGIEPGAEGDVDENNPAVKVWLKGDPEHGVEPLLVPAGDRPRKRREAEAVTAPGPPPEAPAGGDKHGHRR